MVERKEYLEHLIQWKDEQVIKVVTGIRRCGKSTLLLQYQEWLKASGVSDEQIVTINFEELEYEELQDYKKLYAYLKNRLCKGKMTYIFLDEIQHVTDFPKVIDSLYIKKNVDMIVANNLKTAGAGFGTDTNVVTLITKNDIQELPLMSKEEVAHAIWNKIFK